MVVEILHKSLTVKVYEKIKGEILSGSLKPGERLVYENMGKEWNVSLTPWREAIIKLKQEGLVEEVSRGGFYIKLFSIKEIEEMYDIREWLEGLAVNLAIPRINKKEMKILFQVYNKFEDSIRNKDINSCVMNDYQFHKYLVKFSKNKKLLAIMETFNIQLASILRTGPHYLEFVNSYLKEHFSIIEAIKNKNTALAEKLIRSHIKNGKIIILKTLKNMNNHNKNATLPEISTSKYKS